MNIEFSDEELAFLKGFFGYGTYAENPEDDVIFQGIQEKLGNKHGLSEWTVVLRADKVDTIKEMQSILDNAISSYAANIIGIEIMEIYPGDVTATDYELDSRSEEDDPELEAIE